MTSTTEPPRSYSIEALLAEGFSRHQLHRFRKTGVLPPAHGRGPAAFYDDAHLRILRAIRDAQDKRVSLADIAERFGQEFKGYA